MNPTTTATNQTNLPFISQLSPADRSTLIFNALDHIGAYLGAENRGDMFRAFRPFVGEGAKSNPEPNPLLKYRRYHPVDTEALFTRAAEGKTPFDIVDSREVADLRRGLIDLTGHGISNGKLLFECLQTIDLIKQRMAFGHQGGRSLELMPEVQLKKFVVRFSGDSVTVKDAVDFFIAAKMKGVIVSKLVIADWTGIEAQAIDRLFAFMDGVEEISFERCKSEMIDGFLKRGAPFWRNLRSIDLSASYVKPDALEVLLSNCLNLRNLKLSSCFDIGFYRREEIQGLFSKMSLIEELDLSETDSEDLDWFIINGVAFWKNLRSVNLSKSSVSAGAINYLLSNCPIERLNVSHCSEVNAREINTLALSCCKTLSVLNLTGIELSAPIFKAISQLPRLNEITINGKSEESFAGIEMLGKCLELRRLSILAG